MQKIERRGGFLRFLKEALALTIALFICFSGVQTSYAASSAIVGKDGWLFYTGDDTISDYEGTDLFTASQLQAIAARMQLFRLKLALQGCEFVVFIAPNKEQVYSRYMPDSYGTPAVYTRAQQLTDYLTFLGFCVVYPIEELKEAAAAHPEYNFYFYGDTHWNNLGAYIGARALLGELGIEWPSLDELTIEPRMTDQGDLSDMAGRRATDTDYTLSGYSDHPLLMADLTSNRSVARFYSCGGDGRKLLVAGDSFANALSGYLASAFDQVVVDHDRQNYRPSLLTNERPDIYVYEVVERYLSIIGSDYGLVTESDLR